MNKIFFSQNQNKSSGSIDPGFDFSKIRVYSDFGDNANGIDGNELDTGNIDLCYITLYFNPNLTTTSFYDYLHIPFYYIDIDNSSNKGVSELVSSRIHLGGGFLYDARVNFTSTGVSLTTGYYECYFGFRFVELGWGGYPYLRDTNHEVEVEKDGNDEYTVNFNLRVH